MRLAKTLVSIIYICIMLLTIQQLQAQYQIIKGVMANGGQTISDSTLFTIRGTPGQPLIGKSKNETLSDYSGYWYLPGDIWTNISLEDINQPFIFYLFQNHPNPFNPSTKIKFELPKPETVTIEVYNIIGQKIQTLLNKPMPAGYHEIKFNGQNLSSGVYLYRIEAGEWNDVKKMVLIK